MNAVETLFADMKKEIQSLREGRSGEVLLEESPDSAMLLDIFLDPQPDVHRIPVEEIERFSEERRILGLYVPMQSPGFVCLHRKNLREFFWSLTQTCLRNRFITKADLEKVAYLVLQKTYHHEVFHFRSDVLRLLFSGKFDPYLEEALAVAYSRLQIMGMRSNVNTLIGRLGGAIFNTVVHHAYQYRSPGYCDWINYADEPRLKMAVLDYMKPGNYERLLHNNVAVEELIYIILQKADGFSEKVI